METPTSPHEPFGCWAKVSYTLHRHLNGNTMVGICLSDRKEQLLWLLGAGEGLRLNAFPQIRALSPGWRLHSWGHEKGTLEGEGGAAKRKHPQTEASLWVSDICPILHLSSVNNHSMVLLRSLHAGKWLTNLNWSLWEYLWKNINLKIQRLLVVSL